MTNYQLMLLLNNQVQIMASLAGENKVENLTTSIELVEKELVNIKKEM